MPLGTAILEKLCGEVCTPWFAMSEAITITTQMTIEEGRPDIVIRVGKDRVAIVEVKHDASLGHQQLERYHAHLEKNQYKEKQLILLTRSRHSIQETSLPREQFHHVCWYEISGWLSEAKSDNLVVDYHVYQFLDFLREKEMCMEKITWEYMEGVPAMVNLASMLGTALAEALPEEKSRKTAGWNWIGYYIGEGTDIWVGFRYREALKIVFENQNGNKPSFHNELSLPDKHFFSLSAGEQLECLIKFITETYAAHLQVNQDK
ncbi:MAG: PD-(D/E)XK nuclease family protein [Anaerolineales bacterium]